MAKSAKNPSGALSKLNGLRFSFFTVGYIMIFSVCLFSLGCRLFQSESPLPILPNKQPFLAATDLEKLDLGNFYELFGQDEPPVFEELYEVDARKKKDFLGGIYAFNSQGAVAVKLYKSSAALLTEFNDILSGSGSPFELAPMSQDFAIPWWYSEGPPVSVAYTYGNALVVIHSNVIAPSDAQQEGKKLARKMAYKLLQASGGKEFTES